MAVIAMRSSSRVRLSLGPIQYHWSRQEMFDFYRTIEATPIDIVYLGETVCSKRRSFRHQDWLDVAERLQSTGKEVVLSTLALVEANSELGYIRKLCNNGQFRIEANDMAAVQMLAGNADFVGGASLNIYNPRSLNKLVESGLTRWVMPVELSKGVLAGMRQAIPEAIETEVFAWGKLPLAYSARCYTAREHKVSKDDCANCCIDYPDGLLLSTREDEEFLMINGIQTQSARVHNLVLELNNPGSGIDILRISPQSQHTEQVISLFAQVQSGVLSAHAASRKLEEFTDFGLCDGYWYNEAGMATHAGIGGP